MTQITIGQDVVTLINVFTVAPEDQQRLVDLLVEATGQVMSKQPGYLAANISQSGAPPHRKGGAATCRPSLSV
jgi:hypothetical protein